MGTTEPPTFLKLVGVHERLSELFLLHQEALLAGDLALAKARLAEYELDLSAHMRAEEEILMPIYERAGEVPRGPAELFTGEHRKMLRFLRRFRDRLAELARSGRPPATREVIALLDEEAPFKGLVEHHDLRERLILYPTLDRVTSEEERVELLRRCGA
ncbi:MAG: hemerythrin domain-containing protein [Deltaproteobacteria bacterium]|nr:hemerythrin domain-containing protein [Deltaproteobacteria bacterium]